jgi:uncharacterized membrane protein YhaH (DUF805 family)
MFYINFWKRAFDFKGTSKVLEFLACIFFNFIIGLCIIISGLLVPISWENAIVNLYNIVLLLMVIPTISMFVRVIRTFNKKNKRQ